MSSISANINPVLTQIANISTTKGKISAFCIGNTRKINDTGFYFTPLRESGKVVLAGAIVYSEHTARAFAASVDGKVDYVFVDAEKKTVLDDPNQDNGLSNIERAVRETVKASKIVTYKGNDITADALDSFIAELLSEFPRGLGGRKAGIVGVGNVGAKLALKLVERGMCVNLYRRDTEKLRKITEAINMIKPAETAASAVCSLDLLSVARDVDVLIGLTQGVGVINRDAVNVLSRIGVVIDGGKGSIKPCAFERSMELGIPIYRADVQHSFLGHVEMIIETEQKVNLHMGRKEFEGVSVVSAGLMAGLGEVVVDSVSVPSTIMGIGNGRGDFLSNLGPAQVEMLAHLEKYIETRRKDY